MNDFINSARLDFQYSVIFELGLRDSFNPCFLAGFLIFFLYAASKNFSLRQIVLLGINFFYGMMTSNRLLINGYYDRILNQPAVLLGIRVFYFILAAVFLVIGLIHFRDWWKLKKKNSLGGLDKPLPPVFSKDISLVESKVWNKQRKIFSFYFARKVLFVFIIGGLLIILGSPLARDYQVFLYLTKLTAEGVISAGTANVSVLIYNLIVLLPGIVGWLLFVYLINSKRNLRTFSFISYYKIIVSAVFMATAAGLLITFI